MSSNKDQTSFSSQKDIHDHKKARSSLNQKRLNRMSQKQRQIHNMIQDSGFLKRPLKSLQVLTIFEQLAHWFQKTNRDEKHWRFYEPCDHPLYQSGESWQEKTGLSRRVWRKVFCVIGTHYASKSAYLKEADPFQGKFYVSYYDRKENLTYYLKNPDLK